MNEYNFTVQQEGYIFVEADSLEEVSPEIEDDEVSPVAEKFEVEWL